MGQALREPSRPTAIVHATDAFTRDMARLTLMAEGYHVLPSASPGDLAPLIRATVPDLVVLDEAAVVALPRPADVPTIVLLSLASPLTHDDVRDLAPAGDRAPTFYLASPFSPLELTRAARRVRRVARPRVDIPIAASVSMPRARA